MILKYILLAAIAEIMLLKTDLKIKEIAESVGYESVEYFQRLFKKKTGLTPCGYRKAKQNQQIKKVPCKV